MQRDTIDFGSDKVSALFRTQLFPTLLGMVFSALFIVTDGIFVGRGIGSEALAAVNIAAPLFIFSAGFGLMFGMGGAVVASINLSRDKLRVANINATQATAVSCLVMIVVAAAVMCFPHQTARMLGATPEIEHLAVEYLRVYALFAVFQTLLSVLNMFVRIDGPRVALACMITATTINIVLDYVFIFVFRWGLTGAALATGIGEAIGCGMMLRYLYKKSPRIRFGRLKLSRKSMQLTARNTGYIVRLGFPAFIGEAAIAVMMLSGNYVFARYLGTPGVAAFSIVCYIFPIIFMVFNAIIQSAQPIISFNYGCGNMTRSGEAFRYAMLTTVMIAVSFTILNIVVRNPLVSLFIADASDPAWQIATAGIPYFALGYLFFGINVTAIGYYTSIENIRLANIYTLLRGVFFPVLCFFVLPLRFGVPGIWLAVPVAEVATTVCIAVGTMVGHIKARGKTNRLHK